MRHSMNNIYRIEGIWQRLILTYALMIMHLCIPPFILLVTHYFAAAFLMPPRTCLSKKSKKTNLFPSNSMISSIFILTNFYLIKCYLLPFNCIRMCLECNHSRVFGDGNYIIMLFCSYIYFHIIISPINLDTFYQN